MHVFLDLWGTVLDSARMNRAYARRMAEILSPRFGGDLDTWVRAHDEAYAWYSARASEIDWDAGDYLEKVDELDAEHLERILRPAGVSWRPDDPAAYARELEYSIMSSVDARFPDTRPAVVRLRNAGHRVYVVTSATDSNARGSLAGAGLLDAFDCVFTGTTQNLHKSTVAYWQRIIEDVRGPAKKYLLVDDRLEYLEPASAAGIPAVLLDRKGVHPPEASPPFIRATLRNLAGLPHLVDLLQAGKAP